MEMVQAVIVDAVRSPMGRGKAAGSLAALHPVELLAQVLSALVTRNHLDPGSVDDVLVGCVGQNGEQAATSAGSPGSRPGSRSTYRPRRSSASAARDSRP